jgi:MFS family permease
VTTGPSAQTQARRDRAEQPGSHEKRSLRGGERRLLLVLGAPTLAMAFSATIVSTYLPVVARHSTSSTLVIGLIILGEGVMAMFVPLIAGTWSDRFREHGGSRLTFVLAGAPVWFVSMLALSFVRSPVLMGLLVATFFAGNFFSYEPYRALYPDLLES